MCGISLFYLPFSSCSSPPSHIELLDSWFDYILDSLVLRLYVFFFNKNIFKEIRQTFGILKLNISLVSKLNNSTFLILKKWLQKMLLK